ncbi:gene 25-like lysozyme [Rhodobiaceae bacterium]|nr:gene 25-like lysozyme [Rhodobiaceae bacterium]
MKGMNAHNGASLDGIDHLRQSISDILTTPLGSRVMRRDYGSLAFQLIDQAANASGHMLLKAVCAHALAKWEPRVRLIRVALSDMSKDGRVTIDLDLEYSETGDTISLVGLAVS